uniref:Immunoglobulin like and fibronectin type III domain containing 1, tandem duplicate 2 n=1 Tax=Myripristis murdjan TaxID=586833 RepID=A0A667WNA7_9TELE
MITQYVENIPAGKSTPDFSQKPISVTVQEGKKAVFKAVVTGEPAPTVTWGRNRSKLAELGNYQTRYDEKTHEHILEIPDVKSDHADTFKCFATNEYGKAICTALLNVSEVGFKKNGLIGMNLQLPKKKNGEIDPKLWELLLSAPRKDYEKICIDYGVYDFRWMLKRLKQLKKEREDEQAKVVERLDNVKQIEVKPNGKAEFELDMTLKDPNSTINLYKDGMMVLYGTDETSKHCLKQKGTKYVFTINDPQPEDAGFYQVDVEEVNVLATDFQVPEVEFIAQLKDVKAFEGEDAIFQCVLSTPLNRITWSTTDTSLENGDKYEITVSEDKLIHTLKVKDCAMADSRVYYAIAGIASSSATLTSSSSDSGKKKKKKKFSSRTKPKVLDFQSAPSFLVPLKRRMAPQGYECYMSCAIKGDPAPRVTWYRDNISLNTNTNYYITNVCGVCSLLILRVGPKDNGEYKIVIQNPLGTAESSMMLNVRGTV